MYTRAISWSVLKLSIQIRISRHISFMLLSVIMPTLIRPSECIMIFTQASGGGPPRQVIIHIFVFLMRAYHVSLHTEGA